MFGTKRTPKKARCCFFKEKKRNLVKKRKTAKAFDDIQFGCDFDCFFEHNCSVHPLTNVQTNKKNK